MGEVRRLRLGTRGSALARAQADRVRRDLEAAHPGLEVELVLIRTTGDRLRGPLAPVGGKGLFVREIDEALLAGTIDLAVHSMKDVPAVRPDGIVFAATPARADPRDVLISHRAASLDALAAGARIGTASVRRRAQLLARRRDVDVALLRGNVDTRLRRWRAGEFDAIVLAAAGLARLGIDEPAARPLPTRDLLPAVGQGALAIECRSEDGATREMLSTLDHLPSSQAVAAERAFLHALGGDCNTPLAAHAEAAAGRLAVRGQVSDLEGTRSLEDEVVGDPREAAALGRALAERLLGRGAGALIGR